MRSDFQSLSETLLLHIVYIYLYADLWQFLECQLISFDNSRRLFSHFVLRVCVNFTKQISP